MKLSEFFLTKTEKDSLGWPNRYFAEVAVTTGAIFWKKKEYRQITRTVPGMWYFVDNGEFTPGIQAEQLERAYIAQKALREL